MILEHANYVPANWRKNQKGMQPAGIFSSTDEVSQVSYEIWLDARDNAIFSARELMELGVAKEQVNRLLEPFSFIKVIVTSTDYENFFRLRSHKDAQWEIRQLSDMMKEAYHNSTPAERNFHLPYVNMDEYEDSKNFIDAIKQSVARCARVSYATHDGKEPTLESDLELYSRLVEQYPPHASPAEHQIMSLKFYSENAEKFGWPKIGEVAPHALHGNMQYGVVQYRKVLEALSGSSVR
jgi:thymidylate synthase ThyX